MLKIERRFFKKEKKGGSLPNMQMSFHVFNLVGLRVKLHSTELALKFLSHKVEILVDFEIVLAFVALTTNLAPIYASILRKTMSFIKSSFSYCQPFFPDLCSSFS